MDDETINEHHKDCLAAYLRFNRQQRTQALRSISASFTDGKCDRLIEDTYTKEEVEEIVGYIKDLVESEVENELVHACHSNCALLQSLFLQSQKWHLNLNLDIGAAENQGSIATIKTFESTPNSSLKKNLLSPICDQEKLTGPQSLLRNHIVELNLKNENLKAELKEYLIEVKLLRSEREVKDNHLSDLKSEVSVLGHKVLQTSNMDLNQLAVDIDNMKMELTNKEHAHEETQKTMSKQLCQSNNTLQQLKAQLTLAEKELEKKFSRTAAFLNMKKLLQQKNVQIKTLREKLSSYEPESTGLLID